MVYTKKEINGTTVNVEIEVDNMYCRCGECGKELNLLDDLSIDTFTDAGDVLDLFDSGMSICCSECVKKRGTHNAR